MRGSRFLYSLQCSERLWGLLCLLSNGYRRRQAHHSRPCSVEVKNVGSFTSIPPHVFVAQCLTNYAQVTVTTLLLQHDSTEKNNRQKVRFILHDIFLLKSTAGWECVWLCITSDTCVRKLVLHAFSRMSVLQCSTLCWPNFVPNLGGSGKVQEITQRSSACSLPECGC